MADTEQLTHGHKIEDFNARVKHTFLGGCYVLLGGSIMASLGVVFLLIVNREDMPLLAQVAAGAFCAIIGYYPGFDFYAKGRGMLAPRRQTTITGGARMGTKEDLEQAGLIGKRAANDQNIGGGEFDGNEIFYSGERHIGIVGPSGYGKDTGYVFSLLKRLNRPMVVIDAKGGEIAAVMARWRLRFGPMVPINPYGTHVSSHPHLKSVGFNILTGLDPDDPEFFSDCNAISEAAVPGQGKDKEDEFFIDGARALISLCIMTVTWQAKEGVLKRAATLDDVNELLMLPHTSTDGPTLQNTMRVLTTHHDPQVRRAAGRFIADNKTNLSVISTAITAMNNLNDRSIAADLQKTPVINDERFPAIHGKEFHFGMLRDYPITVFVILPENKMITHSVWLRLMVASAINGIRKEAPSTKKPVLVINEAGHLGKLSSLEASMGMGRGKFTVMTIWQHLSQIRRAYGEEGLANFISGWGFLACFACKDRFTAEYISDRIGRTTAYLRSYDAASQLARRGQGDSATGIALRHPDDLERMQPRKAIIWAEPCSRPVEVDVPCYDPRGLDPNPLYVERRA